MSDLSTSTFPQKNSQKGISLLEVLAALVILSIGASVAFTWLDQSLIALNKIKTEESFLIAQNEAMDYLRSINPQERPIDTVDMRGYKISWTSSLIKGPSRTMTALGNPAKYEVSLYELDVLLTRESESQKWGQFKMQLAGYRQVSGGSTSIFGAPVQ